MGISKIHKWERAVTMILNVLGWDLEWTGGKYESFDAKGLPRVVAIGDCPCDGKSCRAGWGWTMKSRDLNMTGHRGSLWAVACEEAAVVFWDYLTTHFSSEVNNLSESSDYNVYSGIKDHVLNEVEG